MTLIWNWIVPVRCPDMPFVHMIEEAGGRGRFCFFVLFFFSDGFISVLFVNSACSENFWSRNMWILVKP